MTEREELFNKCYVLACNCAIKHWAADVCSIEDLKQEALLALWEATDSYDPTRSSFSTYATMYINYRLSSYARHDLFGHAGNSTYFQIALSRVREAMNTNTPLAEVLEHYNDSKGIQQYASMLYNNALTLISLDEPLRCSDGESDTTLLDFVPDSYNLEDTVNQKLYDDYVIKLFDDKFVETCFAHSKRDRKQLVLLMKLYKAKLFGEHLTHADIAEKVGMTRSAVGRQFKIWNRYLKKFVIESFRPNRGKYATVHR